MKLKNSEKNPRKMHFAAIFRPKFQNFFFRCLPWGNNLDPLNYAHSKKLNLWGNTAVDKSAWTKAWLSTFMNEKILNNI